MYERYLELLEETHCISADVARKTEIHPSTFTDWKKGKSTPKIDKLQKIADFFNVNVEWLMGKSDIKNKSNMIDEWGSQLSPISTQRIPMLGEIACGEPIMTEETFECYVSSLTFW